MSKEWEKEVNDLYELVSNLKPEKLEIKDKKPSPPKKDTPLIGKSLDKKSSPQAQPKSIWRNLGKYIILVLIAGLVLFILT